MKTLATLVLLTLICFLRLGSAGPDAPQVVMQSGCCPNHIQMYIPKGKVKHVENTPSHCKSKATVVTTVCNRKFCIDPDWTWTRKLLAKHKRSDGRKTPSPSARPGCSVA